MFLKLIGQNQQLPLRIAFIAILLASIAAKLYFQFGGAEGIQDPGRSSLVLLTQNQKITDFLSEEGLQPRVINWRGNRLATEVVREDHCRFVITAISPKGWDEASIMQSDSFQGKAQYLTRLGLSDQLPVFYSALDLYVTYAVRLTSAVTGIKRSEPMVFVILPQSKCNLSDIRWERFYTLP